MATAEQRAKTVSTKNDADDDSKWPLWTHIVYSSKGKAKLLMQHQVIRAVLRSAIELAEIDVLTRSAWPELETVREVYRRQILNRGAKVVERDDIRAQEVRERVKGSIKYSAVLGDLVRLMFLIFFSFLTCFLGCGSSIDYTISRPNICSFAYCML